MDFHEAILYNDDSLCIRYEDGSVLQLSPCSSAFRFYQNSPSKLPYIQQLTRFTVSSYRKQVLTALSLRNQFACYPYLCKELLNKESIVVCYKEIKECTWPRTVLPEFVVHKRDGSIVVKSLDGYACLTLSSHKKTFTVSYLAQVNQDSKQTQPTQSQLQPLHLKKQPSFYVWLQRGEHSVDDCQEPWLYPLQMALSVGDGIQMKIEKLLKMSNVSELPASLPVTCSASYAHKWMLKEVFNGKENEEFFWQPNLKVVWKNKVLYRVYKSKKEILKIEIYPGDGSFIFSSNLTGKFFTHCTGGKEDKMYSVHQPPPDRPGMKYSIAKLIRQGARLFDFLLHVNLYSDSQHMSQCCWDSKVLHACENIPPETPLQISETATIPNIGRFVAFSNGHLHVAFADRTILNVRYPKSDIESSHQKGILKRALVFNFVLPNGNAIQVSDQNMCGLERYISLACEWGDWVNSSPQERQSFYKDTLYDQDQRSIVESEIGKLRRFNYILNNGTLNHTLAKANQKYPVSTINKQTQKDVVQLAEQEMSVPVTENTSTSVNSALKKTTEAIKGIETFLNSHAIKKII